MNDSKTYYDSIAKVYDEQSKQRIAYLNAVDDIIINDCKTVDINTYLDIGSGNGRRALKIANALNIKSTTLLDNSSNMLKGLSSFEDVYAVDMSIFDFNTSEKFDLITCLWNVIGHFPSIEYMQLFFDKVSDLLSDDGVLIFDVNNRYNISHYGNKSVMKNMQNDVSKINDAGWFTIGANEYKTKVYIHSPFDIYDYLKKINLLLDSIFYVDYNSGIIRDTFFEGQLVYKLRKK